MSFKGYNYFAEALEQNGLDLGDGRKLCVTKWLELLNLPWHKEEREVETVEGGPGGRVEAVNWHTPSTGKRIVFEDG